MRPSPPDTSEETAAGTDGDMALRSVMWNSFSTEEVHECDGNADQRNADPESAGVQARGDPATEIAPYEACRGHDRNQHPLDPSREEEQSGRAHIDSDCEQLFHCIFFVEGWGGKKAEPRDKHEPQPGAEAPAVNGGGQDAEALHHTKMRWRHAWSSRQPLPQCVLGSQ